MQDILKRVTRDILMLRPGRLVLIAVLALAGWELGSAAFADETPRLVPAPATDEQPGQQPTEVAVVAGGCFWGVQGVFQHVKGVVNAVSGYAGGEASTAHYDMTSMGNTGHAESVQITYDPHQITYGQILRVYFSVAHDPTELNRQGPDSGTQYRSAIFPADFEQARIAQAYIAQLNQAHVFGAKVVTTVEPGKTFYRAEDYHQDFLVRNPTYPYIVFNDLPKVRELKKLFPDLYADQPVLVFAQKS